MYKNKKKKVAIMLGSLTLVASALTFVRTIEQFKLKPIENKNFN